MVEGFEPGVPAGEAGGHGVADVGEDAGADACALEALGPVEHGLIELAPEVGVGVDKLGDLLGRENGARSGGGFVPEGNARESASVVVVAVRPVLAVEKGFVAVGDGAHALPGCGLRWGGEDHAVIKENCFDWIHMEWLL